MSSAHDYAPPSFSPRDWIWQSPLVPPALAATIGLLLDRYIGVPIAISLLLIGVLAASWLAAFLARRSFAPVFLCLAVGFLAAMYHHLYRNAYASWDIGNLATDEPKLIRVRGVLAEEPVTYHAKPDPLVAFLRPDPTYCVVDVSSVEGDAGWKTTSGSLRLIVNGPTTDVHCGDAVEVLGWLQRPALPANPGEWDRLEHLRDRRIRAELHVRKSSQAITRIDEGWHASVSGWFAHARHWGGGALQRRLPPDQAALASALLLGEASVLDREEWQRFQRTGVVHVLAVSGQHLMILALFLWWFFRLIGLNRRRGAVLVAGLLAAYAFLTGFEPPVARAAVTVVITCLSIVWRRPTIVANTFALSWLAVILINPTDVFRSGCQLAFAQVAVLIWHASEWDDSPEARIQRLAESMEPVLVRLLKKGLRFLGRVYLLTLLLWFVATPLAAARFHLVSPVGILLSPLVILLTSIALLFGFLLLFSELLGGFISQPLAFVTKSSLGGCDWLVDVADRVPYGHFYVPDVPEWWLWCFYLGVLAVLWWRPLRREWRWPALAGAGWVAIGLAVTISPAGNGEELRITFLAVGHGGCTVLETPDGRVLVYDAGAMRGPEVTRRTIAPYLWSRGYRRIDELFLSHADLDHFNGTIALLERFEVAQITCTPSFADKRLPGVQHTLAEIERRGIPLRVVHAGDLLTAGDVSMEVLHPPAHGPDGNENARSMVLFVTHGRHRCLLTGDIEGPGQERLLKLPARQVHVLMAPHHGGRTANPPEMARWARPQLVVACQGPPRGGQRREEPYTTAGAAYWGTWPHGAIIVRSSKLGLTARTFRTKLEQSLDTTTAVKIERVHD